MSQAKHRNYVVETFREFWDCLGTQILNRISINNHDLFWNALEFARELINPSDQRVACSHVQVYCPSVDTMVDARLYTFIEVLNKYGVETSFCCEDGGYGKYQIGIADEHAKGFKQILDLLGIEVVGNGDLIDSHEFLISHADMLRILTLCLDSLDDTDLREL